MDSSGSFEDIRVWSYKGGEIPWWVFVAEGLIRSVGLAVVATLVLVFLASTSLHRYPWSLPGCWLVAELFRQCCITSQRVLTLYTATSQEHYNNVFHHWFGWFLIYRCWADGMFVSSICWSGAISYRLYYQARHSFEQYGKHPLLKTFIIASIVPMLMVATFNVIISFNGYKKGEVYLLGYEWPRLCMCGAKWILELSFLAIGLRTCLYFSHNTLGAVRFMLIRRVVVMMFIMVLYVPGTVFFGLSFEYPSIRSWIGDWESLSATLQALLAVHLLISEYRTAQVMSSKLIHPLLGGDSSDGDYDMDVGEEMMKAGGLRQSLHGALRKMGLPGKDEQVMTMDETIASFLRALMIPVIFDGMLRVSNECQAASKNEDGSKKGDVNEVKYFKCVKAGMTCKKVKLKDDECKLDLFATGALTSQFAEVFTGMEKGVKIGMRAPMNIAFREIRSLSGLAEDEFREDLRISAELKTTELHSLAKFTEGRGGGFFCFSASRSFIIKTLPKHEYKTLLRLVPTYLEHLRENPKSLLVKLFGCYEIRCHGSTMYVVAMSNIFRSCDGQVDERYDLKGSWVMRDAKLPQYDRSSENSEEMVGGLPNSSSDADTMSEHSSTKSKPAALGLDLDFKRNMKTLCIGEKKKACLVKQLTKDCELLSRHGIMDYSLLVGVWRGGKESLSNECRLAGTYVTSSCRKEIYFIGIIDVLQTYDVLKRLERYAKISLYNLDGNGISVAPPQHYANRFIDSMQNILA